MTRNKIFLGLTLVGVCLILGGLFADEPFGKKAKIEYAAFRYQVVDYNDGGKPVIRPVEVGLISGAVIDEDTIRLHITPFDRDGRLVVFVDSIVKLEKARFEKLRSCECKVLELLP